MKRRVQILATAALLLVLPSMEAVGCQCERRAPGAAPDVEDALAKADFVFFGEVMSSFGDGDPYSDGWRSWDFDVAAVWKGEVSRTARVYAHSEKGLISSCDREFEAGQSYVVFGFLEPDVDYPRFRSHLCSLTTRVEIGEPYAQEIMGRLGEPSKRPPR